jgi:hypothetical protein
MFKTKNQQKTDTDLLWACVPLIGFGLLAGFELTLGRKVTKSCDNLKKGYELEKKNLNEEAVFYYRNALYLDPLSAGALLCVGRVYAKLGELDAAHDI